MSEWKDATSYSRDAPRVQSAWSATFGSVSVHVTTGHVYNRGRWTFHCRPWFDTKDLGPAESMTPEQAQEAAMRLVIGKVEAAYKALIAAMIEQKEPRP